jgi:hypothetical protein
LPSKVSDLTGKKYGRLVVICIEGKTNSGNYKWKCICSCGNETVVASGDLKKKKKSTKSCGCLVSDTAREMLKTHGDSNSRTFISWSSMLGRCYNTNSTGYKNWGGRGLRVCDRWLIYDNFKEDMGTRPESTSLDRIDNSIGYEPSNCRWSTSEEQNNNTRATHKIKLMGKEMSISQWSKYLGIPRSTLSSRILYSRWPVDKALNYGIPYNGEE